MELRDMREHSVDRSEAAMLPPPPPPPPPPHMAYRGTMRQEEKGGEGGPWEGKELCAL